MKTISVVIPTMNRPVDLKKALRSLHLQALVPQQILIIDQSTDDATRLLVEQEVPHFQDKQSQLQYVYQEAKSTAKARNCGIGLATGDLWSFLDDDVELFEDYFEKVMDYFKKDPTLGALNGNVLIDPKLSGWKWFVRKTLRRIFLVSHFDGKMTASGFGYPIYEREIDRILNVEMLIGCNMNMRAEFVRDLRFDEWFTGYSYREDTDYSYSVFLRTRNVIMVPDAKLYHHQSPSNRMDVENLRRMQIKNYYHLFKKYRAGRPFALVLFFYSLLGTLVIDLLEYFSTQDKKNLRKFQAGISEALSIMKG